jgi:putative nucleotidyltransferase with HDIG domain
MPPSYSGALSVMQSLRARGHQALLAGGCVRDRLLRAEPLDYDIATSALPAQVQAAFGVVLVIHGGAAYEVATFRADGPYLDARHPSSVRFAGPEEDARRRDFTVNGMFYDPEKDAVLDFVGGRADLAAGVLRAIGEPRARFDEDRLRVLRCVRFACQLGFDIEADTWAAAKSCAAGDLGGLALERISSELTKILRSPRPRRGLELLDEAGLLAALLPELGPLKGCPQPPEFHPEGDVWEHTLRVTQVLADQGKPSAALAWAGLLHDVAKPATLTRTDRLRFHGHDAAGALMARTLFERLKMGRELSDAACTLVADHLRLDPIKQMKTATLKRLLRRDDIEDLLALHKADCLGSHGDMEFYDFARAKQKEFQAAAEPVGLRPEPLIDGSDLIAWAYVPGPMFKTMLEAVEDEQLEGRLADKASAKAFVEKEFPRGRA